MRRVIRIAALTFAGLVSLLFATLVLLVATGTLKLYAIPSSAMEPTLHCPEPGVGCEGDAKDRVLALTRLVSYERGDIVVFRVPPGAEARCGVGGTFVKRIIGLPGETIRIRLHRGAAYVYVDGRRLEEPYIEQNRRDIGPAKTYRVPEGQYFLMGDNRSQSCDSRVFGPVAEEDVVGRLVGTYWPLDRITIR